MSKHKIAITGKMGSGKTTLCNYIIEKNSQFEKYSFATRVKELAVELFNMKQKDRELLINFANKMRDIDPDVWARYVINQTKLKDKVLIDDLRYFNEYQLLRQNGFKIVKLDISEQLQECRLRKTYPDNFQSHLDQRGNISETNLNQVNDQDFDLVIKCDSDNAFNKIDEFLTQ